MALDTIPTKQRVLEITQACLSGLDTYLKSIRGASLFASRVTNLNHDTGSIMVCAVINGQKRTFEISIREATANQ